MGADFYTDDYTSGYGEGGSYAYGGGGGYYDGGGSLDLGFGDDFFYGYGAGEDLGGGIDLGFSDDFYYGYGAGETGYDTGGSWFDFGGPGGSGDLFDTLLYDYLELGYDPLTAVDLAAIDLESAITIPTSEVGYAQYEQSWPIESFVPFPLPPPPIEYAPYDQAWPIEPFVPFPLPPPPAPITAQPSLPPYCPAGQYHPFPIGHPRQNECIPFPPAQVSKSPAPIPAGAAPKSPAQQPKPPAQQQTCPTGQCKHPQTGQCMPIPQGYYRNPQTQVCTAIPQGQPQQCPTGYYRASTGQCLPIPKCTTPGTVFDQARGLCVPAGQAISPLPGQGGGEFDDVLNSLKEIPWWLWAALGGLLLLGGKDEEKKRVTVQHRRASY